MRVKTVITWAVWILVVVLGANAARLAATRWRGGAQGGLNLPAIEPRTPLVVIPSTIYFDPSAEKALTARSSTTLIVATRADGSQAKRFDSFGRRRPVSSRLIVFASGDVITTNDVEETRTVLDKNTDVRDGHRDPASNCLNRVGGAPAAADQQIVGRERIAGHDTIGIRSGSTTLWLSPALGCAQLGTRMTHSSGEIIEQRATRVESGPPRPELFDIPACYKEVPRERRRP